MNGIPYALHVPIPVPFHRKEEMKANLDKDMKNGIIEPVPIEEAVFRCSLVVVTPRRIAGLGGP